LRRGDPCHADHRDCRRSESNDASHHPSLLTPRAQVAPRVQTTARAIWPLQADRLYQT
jgi:hypothetical protein